MRWTNLWAWVKEAHEMQTFPTEPIILLYMFNILGVRVWKLVYKPWWNHWCIVRLQNRWTARLKHGHLLGIKCPYHVIGIFSVNEGMDFLTLEIFNASLLWPGSFLYVAQIWWEWGLFWDQPSLCQWDLSLVLSWGSAWISEFKNKLKMKWLNCQIVISSKNCSMSQV